MKTNMELNIIASQVEANTTASFPILLEDEIICFDLGQGDIVAKSNNPY